MNTTTQDVDLSPYIAPEAAQNRAAQILQKRFSNGLAQAGPALEDVKRFIPRDTLIPDRRSVRFHTQDGRVAIQFDDPDRGESSLPVHNHALYQMADSVKIPQKFVTQIRDSHPELLAHNLGTLFRDRPEKDTGNLLRVANWRDVAQRTGGEVMGWLTNRFDRYDDMNVIESMLGACQKFGAKPVFVRHFGTHFNIRMMLGQVYQPYEGEALAFGLEGQFAQFGGYSAKVMQYIERPWCLNGATTQYGWRRVHLGVSLDPDTFTEDTMQAQTNFISSAVKDVVAKLFSPGSIKRRCDMVKAANEHQINIEHTLDAMTGRSRITKEEKKRILEIMQIDNTELLPALKVLPEKGHTSAYRLANAFALFAQEAGDERALEVNEIAGELIDPDGEDKDAWKDDLPS